MPRSSKKDSPVDLPAAEMEILAWLWSEGPSTSRRIRDGLAARRPMAHASALTLLARLERKGLVTRRKVAGERGHVYSPTRRPEPTYRRVAADLADRIFGGNSVQLVSSLFEGRRPDKREVQKLRELLDEMEKKSRG